MAGPMGAAGKAAIGIGQSVASALNQPILTVRVMPRSKRGKERFPEGATLSIPAWVVVVSPFIIAYLIGALKLSFGDQLSKDEQEIAKQVKKDSGKDVSGFMKEYNAIAGLFG